MHRQFVPLVAAAMVVLILIGVMAAHALFTGSDGEGADATALINAWPKKIDWSM